MEPLSVADFALHRRALRCADENGKIRGWKRIREDHRIDFQGHIDPSERGPSGLI